MPTMYTLTVASVTKDSPSSGKMTVVFDYASATVSTVPTIQVTVPNYTDQNPNWSRINRVNEQNFMVLRNGAQGVALDMDGVNRIAYALNNSLTFAPVVLKQPQDDSCVASSTAATFTTDFGSELAATYQWQYETKATATLTASGAVSDGNTVVLGSTTYTAKTTLTGAANEVLIGASTAAFLDNLKSAVNGTSGAGTTYGTGTVANGQFYATTNTDTTQLFVAKLSGTAANSYATTETGANLAFGGATASGGGTWSNATGTVNDCAYTNGTTETLTCTPTSIYQSGTQHRCQCTNALGTTTSSEATLTIT